MAMACTHNFSCRNKHQFVAKGQDQGDEKPLSTALNINVHEVGVTPFELR